MVAGRADEGVIPLGDVLGLVSEDGSTRTVVLRGLRAVGQVGAGPREGLLLNLVLGDDLAPADVVPGQVLVAGPPDVSGVGEPRRPRPPRRPDAARAEPSLNPGAR